MGKVIEFPHEPCEFICEDCEANQWTMWIYDMPARVVMTCCACEAEYEMPIED